MVQRVTYRRQCSYNTKSNKVVKVKTPGGRLVVQYPTKQHKLHRKLTGVSANRSKSVSRKYGNKFSGEEIKERIIRAFLTEEVKIVKKVMNQARTATKKEKKVVAKKE